MDRNKEYIEIYRILFEQYGPRGWWPLMRPGGQSPEYFVNLERDDQIFEVAAGAVLTQNTSWKNAARAVAKLSGTGNITPERILELPLDVLAEIIKPSGYYNMKARRLKELARFFRSAPEADRDALLSVYGIGPETADSILLYGFGKREFVVDAYTRRIFCRAGLLERGLPYREIKGSFESSLPSDREIYAEFHALIVEHAKRHCRKSPRCSGCPIRQICLFAG
jgi:endonuclease-3 related protein